MAEEKKPDSPRDPMRRILLLTGAALVATGLAGAINAWRARLPPKPGKPLGEQFDNKRIKVHFQFDREPYIHPDENTTSEEKRRLKFVPFLREKKPHLVCLDTSALLGFPYLEFSEAEEIQRRGLVDDKQESSIDFWDLIPRHAPGAGLFFLERYTERETERLMELRDQADEHKSSAMDRLFKGDLRSAIESYRRYLDKERSFVEMRMNSAKNTLVNLDYYLPRLMPHIARQREIRLAVRYPPLYQELYNHAATSGFGHVSREAFRHLPPVEEHLMEMMRGKKHSDEEVAQTLFAEHISSMAGEADVKQENKENMAKIIARNLKMQDMHRFAKVMSGGPNLDAYGALEKIGAHIPLDKKEIEKFLREHGTAPY